MKTLIVSLILLLGTSFILMASSVQNDSLKFVKENFINSYINKLSRELVLSKDQQVRVRNLMVDKKEIQPFNKSSHIFFEILTDEQKDNFLRLFEIDEASSENIVVRSTLKSIQTSGQYSLVLDDNLEIKDAVLGLNTHPDGINSGNNNYSTYPRVCMHAWTYSGSPMYKRTVVKFILDEIPVGSQIVSATLYFYSDPTISSSSSAEGNSQLSGSNAFYIEQIMEDWNVLSVAWNNQPSSTTQNRLLIPASTSTTENIQIDLSNMVQNWVNAPTYNYGIKMFLQTESYYRSRNYGSMEHPNTTIRLKLIIEYNTPNTSNQNIEYTYDDSGNRIQLERIMLPATLKSVTQSESDGHLGSGAVPINTNFNNMPITIYPNPTRGNIIVELNNSKIDSKIKYNVYDSQGKEVCNGYVSIEGTTLIPLESQPPGVYILIMHSYEGKKNWKIIKQH